MGNPLFNRFGGGYQPNNQVNNSGGIIGALR